MKNLVFLFSFFLFACSWDNSNSEISEGLFVASEWEYDFGDIGINDGVVSHAFNIKNQSENPLAIYGIDSSCGCTSGEILVNDQSVGKGSMKNPAYLDNVVIPQNGEFEVVLYYDPLFHGPEDLGPRDRLLFLDTSSRSHDYMQQTPDGKVWTALRVLANVVE